MAPGFKVVGCANFAREERVVVPIEASMCLPSERILRNNVSSVASKMIV